MTLNYFSESITPRRAILYEFSAWFVYLVVYSFVLWLTDTYNQSILQLPFTMSLLALVFYVNVYLIVIPCMEHDQYIRLVFLTALLLAAYVGARYVLLLKLLPLIGITPLPILIKSSTSDFVYSSLFLLLHYLSLSYGYYFALRMVRLERRKRHDERRIMQLSDRNRRAELAFLRTQLNPHFLFNTLNFFFSDALKVSPKLADGILNLSLMLRTITETGATDKVPVAQEITYIQHYLKIQRYRFNEQLSVHFEVEGEEYSRDFMLPPLILISLVENIFKYGHTTDPDKPAYINVSMSEKGLTFSSKNSRKEVPSYTQSGVGLHNIQQQLELAFRGKASFSIYEADGLFFVDLAVHTPLL